MTTKKVCIVSWHYDTPEICVDYFKKQTPKRSGKWEDLEAVNDPWKADYVFCMDGYNKPLPEDRTIYFGAHPNVPGFSKSYRTFEDRKCLARVRLDKHLNMGEWWIEYDYDYLMNLEPVAKTKRLGCVMTYQTHNTMYAQRVAFMQSFVVFATHGRDPDWKFDLYGRPQERFEEDPLLKKYYRGCLGQNKPNGYLNQHTQGKTIISDYMYTLEFDVGPTVNYASERFYDALLLWCYPIYFGSENLTQYFPTTSFSYLDIYNTTNENLAKIYDLTFESYEDRLEQIAEARDLVLNRYQFWPYAKHVIEHLGDYQ